MIYELKDAGTARIMLSKLCLMLDYDDGRYEWMFEFLEDLVGEKLDFFNELKKEIFEFYNEYKEVTEEEEREKIQKFDDDALEIFLNEFFDDTRTLYDDISKHWFLEIVVVENVPLHFSLYSYSDIQLSPEKLDRLFEI